MNLERNFISQWGPAIYLAAQHVMGEIWSRRVHQHPICVNRSWLYPPIRRQQCLVESRIYCWPWLLNPLSVAGGMLRKVLLVASTSVSDAQLGSGSEERKDTNQPAHLYGNTGGEVVIVASKVSQRRPPSCLVHISRTPGKYRGPASRFTLGGSPRHRGYRTAITLGAGLTDIFRPPS